MGKRIGISLIFFLSLFIIANKQVKAVIRSTECKEPCLATQLCQINSSGDYCVKAYNLVTRTYTYCWAESQDECTIVNTATPVATTAPVSTNTPVPLNTPVSTDFCYNYNDIYINQCENYTLWSSDSPLCYTSNRNVTLYNTISEATEFRYVQTSILCEDTNLTNTAYEPRTAAKSITLTGDFGEKKICAEFKLANGQTDKCATYINYVESTSIPDNTPTPTSILAANTSTPAPTNTPAPTSTPIPTITQAPDCPLKSQGDANCDEIIDMVDFNIWKCQMNTIDASCGAPVQAANFDLLNGVNLNDYEIWRRNYQQIAPTVDVPPPTTEVDITLPITRPTVAPTNTPICCKSGCGCELYNNITTCPLITDKDLNSCTYEFSCRYDSINNLCIKDTSGAVSY